MIYQNVNIDVIEYELPPEIIKSSDIEEQLDPLYKDLKLPKGRLELMSGIKERRLWLPGTKPSDAAIYAGKKALEATHIPIDKIECLISCSVCRDCLEPATATIIHNQLGLSNNSMVFDISNACLGVLTGMTMLANMIELGQVEAGIIVAGENSRSLLESTIQTMLNDKSLNRKTIKPFFASLTIGSGAIAVIMSHKNLSPKGHRLLGGATIANTQYNDLCRGNSDKGMNDGADTIMNTDSEKLMLKGIETASETWNKFKSVIPWKKELVDCFCTHQVGIAHKKLMFEKLDLDLEKDFSTLENLGNIGSVSCPITVGMASKQNQLKKGDNLVMMGIGSGINCSILGVEW